MNNHDELLKGIKKLFDEVFGSAEVDDETRLCRAAVRKFGQMPQVIKACEELAELQQALAKWFLWKYTGCQGGMAVGEELRAHIHEELVDVYIMCVQLEQIFGHDAEMMERKVKHLRELVEMEK